MSMESLELSRSNWRAGPSWIGSSTSPGGRIRIAPTSPPPVVMRPKREYFLPRWRRRWVVPSATSSGSGTCWLKEGTQRGDEAGVSPARRWRHS